MKLLIAEDDPFNQKLAVIMMHMLGFEFDIVSNGQEAVDQAQKNEGNYDLCLMDIDMPVMDGYKAAQIMRHKIKYFPIMAVTANPTIKDKYLERGMDDFLVKPYKSEQLSRKINDLTTKAERLYIKQKKLFLKKEIPMNQEELLELIELKKKGLTKLKLVGTNHAFVVHKNIQNKISNDFIGEGKELSEFIDRSEKEPGRCHLYKANLHVTKDIFIPDELEDAIKKEDQIVMKFNKITDKATKSDE